MCRPSDRFSFPAHRYGRCMVEPLERKHCTTPFASSADDNANIGDLRMRMQGRARALMCKLSGRRRPRSKGREGGRKGFQYLSEKRFLGFQYLENEE